MVATQRVHAHDGEVIGAVPLPVMDRASDVHVLARGDLGVATVRHARRLSALGGAADRPHALAEVAGIEPTGRGSPVPLVLKTRGATRRPFTSGCCVSSRVTPMPGGVGH